MTYAEEVARIHNLIGRVAHLLPSIEREGWLTLTRITTELLDRIKGNYAPRADNKIPVTIFLTPKLVAAMSAIAQIKGLREVSTEEASQMFHEECQRIFDAMGPKKFSDDVAMSLIGSAIVDDADEQLFEAVLLALDAQED